MKHLLLSLLLASLFSFNAAMAQIAPFFTLQPQNSFVQDSNAAAFTLTAAGTPTLAYQWQEYNGSWANLSNTGVYSGSTTNNLSISNSAGLGSRLYRCKVNNASGGDTSQVVKIVSSSIGTLSLGLSPHSGCGADTFLLSGTGDADSIVWFLNGSRVGRSVQTGYASLGTTVATGSGLYALFLDDYGNLYLTEQANARIQKWLPGAASGITVAGGNGVGTGSNQLYFPFGVCVNDSGDVYVSNYQTSTVQKWRPGADTGIIVAGGNGYGANANQLSNIYGIDLDNAGNLLVTDLWNHRVQKFIPGAVNGTTVAGGNGEGSGLNQLRRPRSARFDDSGNIYVGDGTNWRIMKWAPGATSGTQLFTLAGNPVDIWLDESGNLFLVMSGDVVQKWAPGATVPDTVAGGNGAGSAAGQLSGATGVTVDGAGNIYVLDANNGRVQRWEALEDTVFIPSTSGSYTAKVYKGAALVSSNAIAYSDIGISPVLSAVSCRTDTLVLAGIREMMADSVVWFKDGVRLGRSNDTYAATGVTVVTGLSAPVDLAFNDSGNLYVAEYFDHKVTKWSPMGTRIGQFGSTSGSGAGQFNGPAGLDMDDTGYVYTRDANQRVQRWEPNGSTGTIKAGGNGAGSGLDQFKASFAKVFVDDTGNVFVPDEDRIMKWAPGASTGIVRCGGNGIGTGATQLSYPQDVLLDDSGNMYVADGSRIQKFAPGSVTGITVLGGISNGTGMNALNSPGSIELSRDGQYLFACDQANHRVQRLNLSNGQVTTVAGGNGVGTTANKFQYPQSVTLDDTGNIYVADFYNNRIQKWSVIKDSMLVTTASGEYKAIVYKDNCAYSSNVLSLQVSSLTLSMENDLLCNNAGSNIFLTDGIDSMDYQWRRNGQTVGGNDTFLTLSNPANGDVISLVATHANCSSLVDTSNGLTLTVQSATSVTITDITCKNETAYVWNAFMADSIHWLKNGAYFSSSANLGFMNKGVSVVGGNGHGTQLYQLSQATAMALDPHKNLYVADRISPNIRLTKWEYGSDTGEVVSTFTMSSTVLYPYAMQVMEDGTIYLAGSASKIFKILPGTTTPVQCAGGASTGTTLDKLGSDILGLAVDAQGNIYVSDYSNHRVVRWAPGAVTGVLVAGGNGNGGGANQLSYPREIQLDQNNDLYIHNQSGQICHWDSGATSGTVLLTRSGSASFRRGNDGYFYMQASGVVEKWASGGVSGTVVAGGNGTGSGANQFGSVWSSLQMDASDNLYVLDTDNDRVQLWKRKIDTVFVVPDGQNYEAKVFIHACTQTTDPTQAESRVLWTGTTSTSWTDTLNWRCRVLPVDTNNIVIEDNAVNMPLLTGVTSLNSLNLETGTTFTLSGGSASLEIDSALILNGGKLVLQNNSLNILGDLITDNNGSFRFGGNSSLTIAGSGQIDTLRFDQQSDGTTNTLGNFTINRSGSTIVLANKLQVTGVLDPVAGDVFIEDELVLKAVDSTSYGQIAPHGSNAIQGNIVAEKYISFANTGAWRQMGLPLRVNNLMAISGLELNYSSHTESTERNIYYWDAGNGGSGSQAVGWVTADSLSNDHRVAYTVFGGQSDFVYSNARVVVNGTESNGNVQVPLYNYTDPSGSGIMAEGWNLVPNPYPSRMKVSELLNSSEFSSALNYTAVHVWDATSGQYKAITADAISNYNTNGVALDTNIDLAPFQAFWVKASSNTSLTLTNAHRTVLGNPGLFMKNDFDLCRLDVYSPDSAWDQVVVYFKDGAGEGFDNKGDALKMTSLFKERPNLYATIPGMQLTISALPANMKTHRVPLGFKSIQSGTHFFSMNTASLDGKWNVMLEDKLLNKMHDIRQGAYAFRASADMENRFVLHFNENASALPGEMANGGIRISSDLKEAYVSVAPGWEGPASLVIYNMLGVEVLRNDTYSLEKGFSRIPTGGLSQGTYVVVIQREGERITAKVILE